MIFPYFQDAGYRFGRREGIHTPIHCAVEMGNITVGSKIGQGLTNVVLAE
jgi:hypothetical protein